MTVNWFFLFNMADLPDLVSNEMQVEFQGVGQRSVLVTQGNRLGLLVDGIFLALGAAGVENYMAFDGVRAYRDEDGNIWWGYEQP